MQLENAHWADCASTMATRRRPRPLLPLASLIVSTFIVAGIWLQLRKVPTQSTITEALPTPSPTPSPTPFAHYSQPQIPRKEFYTIFFVGDSMTLNLGPHPFRFSNMMNAAYDQSFIIDNYAQGSTSVLQLEELLHKAIDVDGLHMEAPMERDFDLLIIESFGHNPLSQFPLPEGLEKQTETLDQVMTEIVESHPQALVLFLATIGPDEKNYALNKVNLSPELRTNYARERKQYIENFIRYAQDHNIPLIDVYHKSLNPDGSLKRELVSNDNIHPSQVGIEYIQEEVARFVIEKGFLPK